MDRTYAITTCLPVTPELEEYLSAYLPFCCGLRRRVFQDIRHGTLDAMGRAKYISRICREHHVLKRTGNSIVSDMQGRIRALVELKKTELGQVKTKLAATDAQVKELQEYVDTRKPLAAANMLSREQLPAEGKAVSPEKQAEFSCSEAGAPGRGDCNRKRVRVLRHEEAFRKAVSP